MRRAVIPHPHCYLICRAWRATGARGGSRFAFLRRCYVPAGKSSCPAAATNRRTAPPPPSLRRVATRSSHEAATLPLPLRPSLGCCVSAAIQTPTVPASPGAPVSARLRLWLPPLSFPRPPSPARSQTPTFRCLEVWISQMCLCMEQGTLCRMIVARLAVTLRGETGMSPQAAMLLMSLSYRYGCNLWGQV